MPSNLRVNRSTQQLRCWVPAARRRPVTRGIEGLLL